MQKPNIVIILVDDLGWMDLSFQGSKFYQTPNIDRLAGDGMVFSDAYAASPVCSPTRASLLTGKHPARLGVTHYIGGESHIQSGGEIGKLLGTPYVPYLSTDEKTIATCLKEQGYATWHVGKWHLGKEKYWPEQHGFDVNIGGCHMGRPQGKGGYFQPWEIPTLPPKPGDDYLTDRLGDEAAHLIRTSEGPFFLNMCFYSVHTPLQAKDIKIKKYEKKAHLLGLDQQQAIIEGDYHPTEHKKSERIQRRILQSNPVYAAMLEHLDENVGKILSALDEQNLAENTLILFTSDNGGLSTAEESPTCNSPLNEGKGWMYEGGIRVPLCLRWPDRIKAGGKSDVPISTPDIYPTLLEACGLPPETSLNLDGESFAPALTEKTFDRGSLFWHFPHYGNQGGTPASAVRKGDWKLIQFFEGDTELYNLKKDPGETHNLILEQPSPAKELINELEQWKVKINALEPLPNPDWKPWRDCDLNALE